MFWILAQTGAPEGGMQSRLDALARTPLSTILLVVAICTAVRLASFPILHNTAPHLRTGLYSVVRLVNEFMDAIIYAAVVVFMVIRPFGVQTFTIPTGSMLNTLQLNDFIVADKLSYRMRGPSFGEIVVFKPQNYQKIDPESPGEMDYIKRNRGEPGDLIEIRNGVFFRNDMEVREPFVFHRYGGDRMQADFKLVKYKGEIWPVHWKPGELPNMPGMVAEKFMAASEEEARTLMSLPAERIPPDYYLMMGDNREESFDGRFWGLVHRNEVIGRSMFIWFPVSRWQITR